MSNQLNLEQLRELIKMRKERPEEYQELLSGMGDIIKDINEVMQRALR